MPQTKGPASNTPMTITSQRSSAGAVLDTTPHAKAHMGANQVMGFNSSRTALGAGSCGRWGWLTKSVMQGAYP